MPVDSGGEKSGKTNGFLNETSKSRREQSQVIHSQFFNFYQILEEERTETGFREKCIEAIKKWR